MWKKIAVGGAIAAAIVGAGTAAIATSGSTTSGTPDTSASATLAAATSTLPAADGKRVDRLLRRALHGTWVTRDGESGSFITHDAIRGQVTDVSTSSITVKAADNTSETFEVTSSTKVRQRTDGKGAASTIGAVHSGDNVLVVGTGTDKLTAKWVVDVKK
jgi:hypothetical protein